MNSLGWSRRDPDYPVSTSSQTGLLSSIKSLNPFGDRGYVQLPTTEGVGAPLPAGSRREEEEGWFVRESSQFHLLRLRHRVLAFINVFREVCLVVVHGGCACAYIARPSVSLMHMVEGPPKLRIS